MQILPRLPLTVLASRFDVKRLMVAAWSIRSYCWRWVAVQVDGKLSGTRLFHPLADMKEVGELLYETSRCPMLDLAVTDTV